jgi:hypothetical protein
MIDDVEASQSFEPNGYKMFEFLYCLTLKSISKNSIDCLLQAIPKTIIEHNKD